MGEIDEVKLAERLTKIETDLKQAQNEIKDLKQVIHEIQTMSIAMTKLTEQMKTACEDIKDLKTDVNDLKNEPKDKWQAIVKAAISAVVGGILALVLSAIFK